MPPVHGSILVTGARGMLARAVGHELAHRGHRFVAIDSGACDITDAAAVDRAFAQHRPTLLINCAAFTNVDGCEREPDRADRVNGHALVNLATAAKRHGTKLVHVGTDFVFDGTRHSPYCPTDAANPLNAYGRSKLLGERALATIGPPGWLIVRTAWLYGPGGGCFPQAILTAARAGQPLRVVADQVGSPTFTHDLAAAMLDLIARDAAGIYHATNAGQTSWFDFATAVLAAFDVAAHPQPIRTHDWQAMHPHAAHRPAYSVLDCAATEAAVGRPLALWNDALARYAIAARGDA